MTLTVESPDATEARAPKFHGFDHVEWWVGNARHTAAYFANGFGFDVVAYRGPETGDPDAMSYLLVQGDIRFVITSGLDGVGDIARHVLRHGDGVRAVALRVDDCAGAYGALVERGAAGVRAPAKADDGKGRYATAKVATYGDTVHGLIERDDARELPPGFEPVESFAVAAPTVGLTGIDHVVGNVERGALVNWVNFYERVFGFGQLTHFGADQITTEFSALESTVVWDGDRVVMPINEPADGRKRSQIQEYLDYYGSPGVQHLALKTDDIVSTVESLRARGIRCLDVPPEYYDDARARLGGLDVPWDALAPLGILVDRDHDGYLLQIFTENVASRPTVFVEIIQRFGARGFGEGNFKALFEAIERAQAARGNL
ncbi:MAG TPA: 4-hydroxyphenylpyruvate dioxygenase [Acidimicrobiia bacterium]|nr:4-hydroxyphenylpyruvate dioxygenase [Acidimicrobiia bacterium]